MAWSWFKPKTNLDTVEQIQLLVEIEKNDKNYWIKGFAGSGKSLLLVHCLIDEKLRHPESKVIIVLYTHSLVDMIRVGIPEKFKDTPVVTYFKFRNIHQTFDLILVDEIQDIPEQDLREISSKGKRVIVAGDNNQSIWDNRVSSEKIQNILNAKISTLYRIYRLSRKIRSISAPFCEDADNYRNAQVMSFANAEYPPLLIKAKNYLEECNWLWMCVQQYRQYVPAILVSTKNDIISLIDTILDIEKIDKLSAEMKNDFKLMNDYLSKNSLGLQYLGSNYGSLELAHTNNLITIMTYHSAKGLDFKAVFIPFLNSFYFIGKTLSLSKVLFFVALTRSREQLLLSYSGDSHSFLSQSMVNECDVRYAQDEINRMTNPTGNFSSNEDEIILI
jgi:superfamily I DNA/RNA helicase